MVIPSLRQVYPMLLTNFLDRFVHSIDPIDSREEEEKNGEQNKEIPTN